MATPPRPPLSSAPPVLWPRPPKPQPHPFRELSRQNAPPSLPLVPPSPVAPPTPVAPPPAHPLAPFPPPPPLPGAAARPLTSPRTATPPPERKTRGGAWPPRRRPIRKRRAPPPRVLKGPRRKRPGPYRAGWGRGRVRHFLPRKREVIRGTQEFGGTQESVRDPGVREGPRSSGGTQEFGRDPGVREGPRSSGGTQEFGGTQESAPPPMDVTYAVITKPRRPGGGAAGSHPAPSGPAPSGPAPNPPGDGAYEVVTPPAEPGSSAHLGFNSRIRKPKGPREPPADWTRA
ncbi:tyrosine-protein phosphatase non-receptor type 18 [Caloenas nicobarica]|uniref:tyrosine-protein phosphatase non-receptor type 18 n=1 Tax=Caloenas nicobarica TaxID=187106 RepID=UPI0032B8398A